MFGCILIFVFVEFLALVFVESGICMQDNTCFFFCVARIWFFYCTCYLMFIEMWSVDKIEIEPWLTALLPQQWVNFTHYRYWKNINLNFTLDLYFDDKKCLFCEGYFCNNSSKSFLIWLTFDQITFVLLWYLCSSELYKKQ